MNITKTTINFATKRNIELIVDEETVMFYSMTDDCEPALIYSVSDNGLFFKGNVWLTQSTKEELPHWIENEKQLRQVIDFLALTGEL